MTRESAILELVEAARAVVNGVTLFRRGQSLVKHVLLERVADALATLDEMPEAKPPIPEDVYYSAENDNFYDAVSRRGMGLGFWLTWKNRRSDFPGAGAAGAKVNG